MGGIHFEYLGGQFASGLSMISYLRSGQYRDRYLACPSGHQRPALPAGADRHFAAELADRLVTQPRRAKTRAASSAGRCSWIPRRPAAASATRRPLPRRREHPAQVGSRSRSKASARPHSRAAPRSRCTRQAAVRTSPGTGHRTSWWQTSAPCSGRVPASSHPDRCRFRDGLQPTLRQSPKVPAAQGERARQRPVTAAEATGAAKDLPKLIVSE